MCLGPAELVKHETGCVCLAPLAGGEGDAGSSKSGVLSTWDALASTLPADIPSQPSMLQRGTLREYQMQVREGNHLNYVCVALPGDLGTVKPPCSCSASQDRTQPIGLQEQAGWPSVNSICAVACCGVLSACCLQGVRWLVGLCEKGLNGILADDMGLGKTVQVSFRV